jgi:hypothetical protein
MLIFINILEIRQTYDKVVGLLSTQFATGGFVAGQNRPNDPPMTHSSTQNKPNRRHETKPITS